MMVKKFVDLTKFGENFGAHSRAELIVAMEEGVKTVQSKLEKSKSSVQVSHKRPRI